MYNTIDTVEDNHKYGSSDNIEQKVYHCCTFCIFAGSYRRHDCCDTRTDILSHNNRNRCRIADSPRITQRL